MARGGENTKKVAGNARKAAAKAEKDAAEDAKRAAAEDGKWQQGAKSSAKKENEAAKKAEAARKKADRDAQLAEEEAGARSKPKVNPKAGGAAKKIAKPLDLGALDTSEGAGAPAAALNASGIDDALDALALGGGNNAQDRVEKHPEKRFRAAYAAFEARRLPEIEQEHPGLRRQQRVDLCRKEFDKSAENPFNQVTAQYNATREDMDTVRSAEREKTERRLEEKS